MPDLDFDGQNTLYGTHGLHAFAAKCPPQLARYAIELYSEAGQVVLDPMAGSGTTLVEARLMGRSAVGVEIDPVAALIAKVKATPLCESAISEAYDRLEQKIRNAASLSSIESGGGVSAPEFHNRDYWFRSEVSRDLTIISDCIASAAMAPDVRGFFWVALSSIVLARTSVANARDIIHSRHHHFHHERVPDVIERFRRRVTTMRAQVTEFSRMCTRYENLYVSVMSGDARQLSLPDESVDLVFTSPPYATALDYPRAHFLSVPWLEPAIRMNIRDYLSGSVRYIGTERGRTPDPHVCLEALSRLPKAYAVVASLVETARRQAGVIAKYFMDMRSVLDEAKRVLKAGQHLVFVVCPSHIRKVQIPTNTLLREIAEATGLNPQGEYTRTISERRRVLPYVDGDLRKRMDTEYVLVFRKP